MGTYSSGQANLHCIRDSMSDKILSALEPSAVLLQSSAADKLEVITELGNRLYRAGYVKESFVEAALARERELPTGLPLDGKFNAAIPHTDVEHVISPGLALATLSKPVMFKNMVSPEEDVPVQLVILMALDQPKSQVEMLQEISQVLQNKETIERLMAARSYSDVEKAFK
jgi:PTS system galactitol-specific IIA component